MHCEKPKSPSFQTFLFFEEGLGGHGEVVFCVEGGVGGLDGGNEGCGVFGGGGDFLDVKEVGAFGGDGVGAFGEVVGGEDNLGVGGGEAVALGDGGIDGFWGSKETMAVGAEEVGGGEFGGWEVEVESVAFVADDEVESADGKWAFGDGLGGCDGLEEGTVEGVLETVDDAVDGAAGLEGGAGAGGGGNQQEVADGESAGA